MVKRFYIGTVSLIMNLVLVHVGDITKSTLIDCLFQVLLLNNNSINIHVLVDKNEISVVDKMIKDVNWSTYGICTDTIAIHSIDDYQSEKSKSVYNKLLSYKLDSIRNGFWIHTLTRFFTLSNFINKHQLKNIFHIENDVMMYKSFNVLYNTYNNINGSSECTWVVKDSVSRVIPSVLFWSGTRCITRLADYMYNVLEASPCFINDMDVLGKYQDILKLPSYPGPNTKILFDGAAIGQYLGGIDSRNIGLGINFKDRLLCCYKTSGFINETSIFKPNSRKWYYKTVETGKTRVPIKVLICNDPVVKSNIPVANIHVHSKMLYKFSSIFGISLDDIVSGDRIVRLSDMALMTNDIRQFHKGVENYTSELIVINNFENIDHHNLNRYILKYCTKHDTTHVKLFIYTHILEKFQENVLDKLSNFLTYTLYIHNSDHVFDKRYQKILDCEYIKHVFAQNLNILSKKASLLPIGIANSMWKHGNLYILYKTMCKTYISAKKNGLYVNINTATFPYRKILLDAIKVQAPGKFMISSNLPYKDYLLELSSNRFCLCIRGNGIDTHRFWECLYLGVIPVIINNKETMCQAFVKNLRYLDVPFYEITSDSIEEIVKYDDAFFTQELYDKIIHASKSSIYNLDCLKLSSYQDFTYL